ncbi:MAG: methyltransferase domain-containing protein [Deltaproteobacteria bacterium]|nr:methyltransferase domain-containing protein [Deltaproteobacteria bacterium]MBW2531056.1 methyltransferase domain-containing protein [Deltaproteobacteria bacterium]
MSVTPDLERARVYYDEFATRYDEQRGGRVPSGYHDLIDDLELDFLERYARDKRVLEVGCGTGLLLGRIQRFAAAAQGVDLSEGMLAHARRRGLDVVCGSATELPFEDEQFDVTCSFKVLAHVEQIERALSEMVRVLRPGGMMIAEFYNPHSFRGLVKRWGPARRIGRRTTEAAVHTRFDTPSDVRRYLPPETRIEAARGVRVLTPVAAALRLPLVGRALRVAEWKVCDSFLARFGGFWIAAIRKDD